MEDDYEPRHLRSATDPSFGWWLFNYDITPGNVHYDAWKQRFTDRDYDETVPYSDGFEPRHDVTSHAYACIVYLYHHHYFLTPYGYRHLFAFVDLCYCGAHWSTYRKRSIEGVSASAHNGA